MLRVTVTGSGFSHVVTHHRNAKDVEMGESWGQMRLRTHAFLCCKWIKHLLKCPLKAVSPLGHTFMLPWRALALLLTLWHPKAWSNARGMEDPKPLLQQNLHVCRLLILNAIQFPQLKWKGNKVGWKWRSFVPVVLPAPHYKGSLWRWQQKRLCHCFSIGGELQSSHSQK